MTIVANAAVPHQQLPGLDHQTLANQDTGLKNLSMWRQTVAAGAATPPHRHDCEEIVLVQTGSGELHLGGKVTAFGPDSTLVIPRNADHQIINTGKDDMNLVAAFASTGFDVHFPDGQRIPLPWRT
jgi:quercetin dioxygenase-like cupin family protein